MKISPAPILPTAPSVILKEKARKKAPRITENRKDRQKEKRC